jgi:hypothetical protein
MCCTQSQYFSTVSSDSSSMGVSANLRTPETKGQVHQTRCCTQSHTFSAKAQILLYETCRIGASNLSRSASRGTRLLKHMCRAVLTRWPTAHVTFTCPGHPPFPAQCLFTVLAARMLCTQESPPPAYQHTHGAGQSLSSRHAQLQH